MNTKKKRPAPLPTLYSKSKITKKPRYIKSGAVKLLESVANRAARIKYPMIPPEYLAPRKYRDDTSNGLTKCIIDFLRLKGCQAERISNMGRQISTQKTFIDVIGRQRTIGNSKWIPGSGTNGTADISSVIKGLSVKIEIKIGRDRQSEAQRQYQKAIKLAGGIYIIATSFAQFHEWYIKNFSYG